MEYVQELDKWLVKDNFVVSEVDSGLDILPAELTSPAMLTIIIISKGNVSFVVDRQNCIVGRNSVIHTSSERLIKFNSFSEDFCGKIIVLNRDIVNVTATGFSPNTYLYMYKHPVLHLNNDEMGNVLDIFGILKIKYDSTEDFLGGKVFHCLVMALYFQLIECMDKRVKDKPKLILSHKENLYRRFLTLLRENVRKEHSVNFYANRLCLTPQYISSVLKELSGKSANKWIDEMLLAEAKFLLFTTENNIQQIADQLNFPDQSSFGKFFKKMTGYSPSNYKKRSGDIA